MFSKFFCTKKKNNVNIINKGDIKQFDSNKEIYKQTDKDPDHYDLNEEIIDLINKKIELYISKFGTSDIILFKGKIVPKIPLNSYLYRLIGLTLYLFKEEMFVLTIFNLSCIYIDKILEKGFILDDYNIHRVFFISFLMAVKYLNDDRIYMSEWAKIGGIDIKDLLHYELEFCKLINYEFYVDSF